MKTVTINIQKLGPIRNAKIELKPFMLFSGESGLGKSYVAMLCHYIYYVLLTPFRFDDFFKGRYEYEKMRPQMKNEGTALSISKTDLENWLASDAITFLEYMISSPIRDVDIKITISGLPEILEFTYREEILGLVDDEDVYLNLTLLGLTYRIGGQGSFFESPYAYLLRHALRNHIWEDYRRFKDSVILPPSRGSVLTEDIKPRTGLYQEFSGLLDKIKTAQRTQEGSSSEVISILTAVLDGGVAEKQQEYYYTMSNGTELPLSASAASVKELASLSLIASKMDISSTSMLMEEPEAHLHPAKQRMMADVMACFHNAGTHLQITTHSDYFIRRLNELIAVFRIKERGGEVHEKLGIDATLSLNPDNIGAYLLSKNKEGYSELLEQSLDEGIPFASFAGPLKSGLRNDYIIAEYLGDGDELF